MEPRTLHTLELIAAVVGQTFLLAAAWAFIGAVLIDNPLVFPDRFALFIFSQPTVTTWVVTLIATIVSVATTAYLSIAFKEALRHRMHKPISLIHLSSGIALARGSYLISFRHLIPTFATLVVFGLTKLLVSSWSALLAPSLVTWSVNAASWELDLTSSWFESMLQQELVQSGAALVRGNSTQLLNLDGVLSGIAAAQFSYGKSGIFDFNGNKYNVSTGGVLPAAPGYGGMTEPVSSDNDGLAFAGGRVPTHLDVHYPNNRTIQGLYYNFTLQQQGLTANVTCRTVDSTTDVIDLESSFTPIPVPLGNGTTDYWLWAWNITANCAEGLPSQQQYVTRSNSSTVPQGSSAGIMSSVVCPYPLGQTGFSWDHFSVVTNASWRYDFLPLMICKINPLSTTTLVSYSNDSLISTTVINTQPLGSSNTNLTQFLAALVDYQSRTAQGLSTNSIGDALYAIYVSASQNNSTSAEDVINLLIEELEQYWRGVIEFSGTFLRSGFSAQPSAIPIEAQIPVNGNKTVTTVGWYRRSELWGYTIIPITLVAVMMYAAVVYTLWSVYKERGHESFTRFDPSNPIHLMMASSARDPSHSDTRDDLGDRLNGFEHSGIGENEKLRVELENIKPDRKRFKVFNSDSA